MTATSDASVCGLVPMDDIPVALELPCMKIAGHVRAHISGLAQKQDAEPHWSIFETEKSAKE